jgi:hypothetical protein
MKYLGPIIEERRKHLDKREYGEAWVDKPVCRSRSLLGK